VIELKKIVKKDRSFKRIVKRMFLLPLAFGVLLLASPFYLVMVLKKKYKKTKGVPYDRL